MHKQFFCTSCQSSLLPNRNTQPHDTGGISRNPASTNDTITDVPDIGFAPAPSDKAYIYLTLRKKATPK